MNPDLLVDDPVAAEPIATLALAHGAGAQMDSPFMTGIARRLAVHGLRVVRFEFPYMNLRRIGGGRRPPDRQPVLLDHWRAVIDRLGGPEALVIGGKSMGGRMASLIAAETAVRGLVCLGYPFHPPGRPEHPRVDHLARVEIPGLIVQGTRDPFGRPEEVVGYRLGGATRVHWIEDGDHDLKPRKRSGRTHDDALDEAAMAVRDFVQP